ncbi:MAG: VanZ family protein [bacterium]|nr:VanZ family protein [bacterium]
MRISDLINLAQRYLTLGLVALVVMALVFVIGYFLVYRRVLKGEKKVRVVRLLWWAVLICYVIVVIGATLMGRSGFWQNTKIMPLFYSYLEAWVNFSTSSWRNIILNICMFVPLGFWLPVGMKKFRCFWKTYLTGFAFTMLIELTQLLLKRGIFELDDIMNNTLGTMIGYGCFVFAYAVCAYIRKNKEEKRSLVSILALQLPLVITLAVFMTIFVTYEQKELGNVSYQYIYKYDKDLIDVTTTKTYSDQRTELPVYISPTASKEECIQFAEQFFHGLGEELDQTRNDFYNDTAIFYAMDTYNLWVDYKGETYSFTDFDALFEEVSSEKRANVSEKEIREALLTYQIDVPKQAEFKVLESGQYQFTADMISEGSGIINGSLVCGYYGNRRFSTIENNLISCSLYKQLEAISEKEAYERICEGKFNSYESGRITLEVRECKLKYVLDTKGFYQPVYQFACTVNGQEETITIPALK